jgi:hypothetical protein
VADVGLFEQLAERLSWAQTRGMGKTMGVAVGESEWPGDWRWTRGAVLKGHRATAGPQPGVSGLARGFRLGMDGSAPGSRSLEGWHRRD